MNFIKSRDLKEAQIAEENRELLTFSEEAQMRERDCLDEGIRIRLPSKINFELRGNNLFDLQEIWKRWEPSRRYEFTKRFGHIGYLLMVPIDKNMIRAAVQFWDPFYRCFTFNNSDLVPLMEEYCALLDLPITPMDAYLYDERVGPLRKLSAILGFQHYELERRGGLSKIGSGDGFRVNDLHEFIIQHPSDKWGLNAMALAIYGLVMFPRAIGYVDAKVISLFSEILAGVHPVPAILAETFRSLNHCQTEGKGRFIGCSQMLQVWLLGHLKCMKHSFKPCYHPGRIPIIETIDAERSMPDTKEEWEALFRDMSEFELVWRAPWMVDCNVIYGCGSFYWVPLLGPWGISYAPTLARRQVGARQFAPYTTGLNRLEFSYVEGPSDFRLKNLVDAWKQIKRVRPGIKTLETTTRYVFWLQERERGFIKSETHLFEGERNNEPEPMEVTSQDALQKLAMEKENLEKENHELIGSLHDASKKVKKFQRYLRSIQKDDKSKQLKSKIRDLKIEKLAMEEELQQVRAQLRQSKEENIALTLALNDKQEREQWLENECSRLGNECQTLQPYFDNHNRVMGQVNTLFSEAENISQTARRFVAKIKDIQGEVLEKYPHEQGLLNFLVDVH